MNREQDYWPEDRQTARYQRILVGTDGSECSMRAGAHAVYLAEVLGAHLYALYPVNVQRAFHMGIHFGEAVAELGRFGQDAIDAVREMAQERGLECEKILVEGVVPHKSIIRASDEIGADLIVLGSTGMTSLERALIGSESQKVLLYSERPVLLVHEP